MRTKKQTLVLAVTTAVLAGTVAHADLIIDTGVPSEALGGWSLESGQWLAGEITLDQNYTITGIEGFMFELTTGNMEVVIYNDGGNIPGTTELYSATFYADLPGGGWSSGWVGTDSLSWDLGPGTYWIAFEVSSGYGSFAMPAGAPNPLSGYAVYYSGGWSDDFWSDDSLGFRVYADSGVVPEPATMSLLGLGFAALGLRRARRWTRSG